MGTWQALGAYFGFGPVGSVGIASPYRGDVAQAEPLSFVAAELLDYMPSAPVSRAAAMAVPPVSRGRQIICGSIAPLPLVKRDVNGPTDDQPEWLYRTSGILSPSHRMTWTLDDGVFYGESLWLCTREAAPAGELGEIIDAIHVPYTLWELGNDGVMRVGLDMDGRRLPEKRPVNDNGFIYFPFHIEGLLYRAGDTLREGAQLHKTVADRAAVPIPVVELHQNDADANLSKKQVRAMIDAYNKARRDPAGVTTFTPSHIDLRVHGDKAGMDGAIQAKNGVRLDVAAHLGLPAAALDGSLSTASLTYTTEQGAKETLESLGLGPWMDSVTGRLSQDDVTPAGTNIRFDASALFTPNPAPTGQPSRD